MIKITSPSDNEPYKKFQQYYEKASINKQKSIEAILISSFNKTLKEVDSRFVNLKYIRNNEWIFFSNYNSSKAKQFDSHNQISAVLYWDSIELQIRLKAKIKKTSTAFSNEHFKKRAKEKNALAISSDQSAPIKDYDNVLKRYNDALSSDNNLKKRPDYWGGYSFQPYYFEFWEGHPARLNKRESYEYKDGNWHKFFL